MAVSIEQHVDWVADCLDGPARAGLRHDRADPAGRGRLGAARQRLRRHHAPSRRRTPGTWVPTCRASRACSCPTSAASTRTARSATRWSPTATSASSCPGPAGAQCNDGVVRRLQPDVAMVLDMMAALDLPPLETMSPTDARAFMEASAAMRPPGPEVGEVIDGVLARRRTATCRTGSTGRRTGAAPDRRLLPRRRLGARQPGLGRSVLPRPVRALRRGDRLGELPPRPRGTLPGRRRRRLRGGAVGRTTTPSSSAASPVSSPSPAGARAATSPQSPRQLARDAGGPAHRRAAADQPGHRLRHDPRRIRRTPTATSSRRR